MRDKSALTSSSCSSYTGAVDYLYVLVSMLFEEIRFDYIIRKADDRSKHMRPNASNSIDTNRNCGNKESFLVFLLLIVLAYRLLSIIVCHHNSQLIASLYYYFVLFRKCDCNCVCLISERIDGSFDCHRKMSLTAKNVTASQHRSAHLCTTKTPAWTRIPAHLNRYEI